MSEIKRMSLLEKYVQIQKKIKRKKCDKKIIKNSREKEKKKKHSIQNYVSCIKKKEKLNLLHS